MYFAPQTLNPKGLVLPKLCLYIGYFVLNAIRPRDVTYLFYKLPLGGPCMHFGGSRVGLISHC